MEDDGQSEVQPSRRCCGRTLTGICTHAFLAFFLATLFARDLAAASVSLTWKPSPDPRTTGYIVVYGIASRIYLNSVNVGNATEATLSNLVPGNNYYFSVYAYGNDSLQSELANEVSFLVPAAEASPSPPAVALASPVLGTPLSGAPGSGSVFLLRSNTSSGGGIQLAFYHPGRTPLRIWHTRSLAPARWREVPPTWVRRCTSEVTTIELSREAAGAQAFFILESSPVVTSMGPWRGTRE